MKKRLFKIAAKETLDRDDFIDRPAWRRALNLYRKCRKNQWPPPKRYEGMILPDAAMVAPMHLLVATQSITIAQGTQKSGSEITNIFSRLWEFLRSLTSSGK